MAIFKICLLLIAIKQNPVIQETLKTSMLKPIASNIRDSKSKANFFNGIGKAKKKGFGKNQ